ncbi:sigma-E factor regulatory protein RseB domain-containing protein [candidate division KSB1 bacterium]
MCKYYCKKVLMSLVILLAVDMAAEGLFCTARSQQGDLQAVFDRIRTARRTVSYEGEIKTVIKRERGDRTINKKITAKPPRDFTEELILTQEEKERLEEFRKRRTRDMPESRRRRYDQMSDRFRNHGNSLNSFANTRVNVELLQQNYEIIFEEGNEVAGRFTHYISIMPKYELRIGNKIWIDKETGIVLKREWYQPQDLTKPAYIEEFTRIEYGDVIELPDRRTESDRSADDRGRRSGGGRGSRVNTREFNSIEELPERIKDNVVIPGQLPQGFALDKLRITRERDHVTIHQIYTDGLIMFSIFQMRGQLPEQLKNAISESRQGQRRQGGRIMLHKKVDRNNFVVVGDALRELLQTVLDSIPDN